MLSGMVSPYAIQCIRLYFAVHADWKARYKSLVLKKPHMPMSSSRFFCVLGVVLLPFGSCKYAGITWWSKGKFSLVV